ncbi:hypothetical protein HYT52_03870 [Candidatus Woesearchaeota archaeon]|nr:hypothetical protein [Candidatus Woesearchaeota archaeon]
MELATANTCIECDDIITEPICPECLAHRMQEFVHYFDQKLAEEIESLVVEDGETSCIFCGKKMNLCAHCFSKEIYQFLQEKNPQAAEEFLGRFDFDLRRNMI